MYWIKLGSVIMFLGVALGAFGAHGLKDQLSLEMKAVYQTAVLYHMIHGLGILLVGSLLLYRPMGHLNTAGWLFSIGILLFSGSLYALSITGISRLGAITPLGGLAFLAGWVAVFMSAFHTP